MSADSSFIVSTGVLLFLMMDPFGNLPLFISILREIPDNRYPRIVIRESLIALAIMILAVFGGRVFMRLMGLRQDVLMIAGGLILLLMGIKMVFSTFTAEKTWESGDRMIVPLAIPLICGPGTIAMLVTLRGSTAQAGFLNVFCALLAAWVLQTAVLLSGRRLSKLLGTHVMDAIESLMGLLLTCIAVGMLISGINQVYGIPAR